MKSNIIIVNLERAVERKKHILQQLSKSNINEDDVIIYPAFDGKLITNSSFNANIEVGYGAGRKMKNGEIGCILSHIEVIKLAKILNYEYVIVLEDDIVMCNNFLNRVKNIFKILPSNWEHIFLSGHVYNYEPLVIPNLVPSPKVSGTYSYILKNTAYDKVIANLNSMLTVADDLYERMYANKNLNSFIHFPFLTYPLQEYSYIWEEKGQFDKHPSFKFFKE